MDKIDLISQTTSLILVISISLIFTFFGSLKEWKFDLCVKIKLVFKFKPFFYDMAKSFIKSLKTKFTISLHLRFGDYFKDENFKNLDFNCDSHLLPSAHTVWRQPSAIYLYIAYIKLAYL